MKFTLNLIAGSLLALACTAAISRAELVLSGHTSGSFEPSANPNTLITNSPDGLLALFRTGVPVGGSFKSGVNFNGHDFAGITSGDTFSLGLVTYYNGITKIGTSSGSALLDFSLTLDNPALGKVNLTTIKFGVDATVNTPPNLIPDAFTASFTQPPDVMISNELVRFRINDLPLATNVAENSWTSLASVTVTYLSPVPEPATYGLGGALGLVAVIAYGRLRKTRHVSPPMVA